jgi:redox-sensing transcriptional repressor
VENDAKHKGVITIPEPTLRRLPIYYQYLKNLESSGTKAISCTTIGNDLNFDPTQVRKDLSYTRAEGKPKVGYLVEDLIREIEEFLGWNKINAAFLVGAGNLGTALLGYSQFRQHGLSIVAAFDQDESKIGHLVHGKRVLALEKLPGLAQRMGVRLGIITVPPASAQQVADLMVQGGIQAIWNFAPVTLKVIPPVLVRNEELYYSLASLSHKLAQTMNITPRKGEEVNVNSL